MSQKTDSSVGVLGTVLAIAGVLIVVFVVLPNMKKTTTEDDAAVTITVLFTPETRSGVAPPGHTLKDVVTVEVEMKPLVQEKHPVTQSGWTYVLTPAKGQRIWVKAGQMYGTYIACKLTRNGKMVDQNSNTGPRAATCSFTSY